MSNFKSLFLIAITLCQLFMSSSEAAATHPVAEVENLTPEAAPIRDLTIIYWFGRGAPGCPEQSTAYTTTFKSALASRFPAMFTANGIPVIETIIVPTPLKYQHTDNGGLTLPIFKRIKTSHALVMIEEEFSFYGNQCSPNDSQISVIFDTRLWDVANNRQLYVDGETLDLWVKQPLRRSQDLARVILYHLSKNKVISLKDDDPIGLDGKIAELNRSKQADDK